jgi:hypothetical protein
MISPFSTHFLSFLLFHATVFFTVFSFNLRCFSDAVNVYFL